MYYTYILQSKKNKKFYTGATSDLRKRLVEHNQNEVQSTKNRGPFNIIYYEACKNQEDAFTREKYLKSGLGKRYLKNRIKRFLFLTGQVKKVYPVRSKSPKATADAKTHRTSNGIHPVRSKSPKATADAKTHRTSNGGFMALMSAVLISFVLLAVTFTLGSTGFFSRFNILDSESKEQSYYLAKGCVDMAMLEISYQSYPQNKIIDIGPGNQDVCLISTTKKDKPLYGQSLIKTQATINGAVTNLLTVIDENYIIIYQKECPNFTNSDNSC